MNNLSSTVNIGKVLSEQLQQVGIDTIERLREVGSENALIRIQSVASGGVCLSKLYALEGAIQNIRWHNLSEERKLELKDFFDSLVKK
ncbi:MAG: TfoX/Sxy family protein [Prevotellaceae bacterium]|jgi:DNA transformation protein|nr:TfoX/Sxy family protein [Prevotellaceae bacterium]